MNFLGEHNLDAICAMTIEVAEANHIAREMAVPSARTLAASETAPVSFALPVVAEK